MSRQINNTTGLAKFIDDIGVSIPAGLYTLPPERYWYFASSADIDTFIDASDFIIIHDGVSLNAYNGKCLIHEATDYAVAEIDTPSVSIINQQTKVTRYQGPLWDVTNTVEGRTDVDIILGNSAEGKEATYQFFQNGTANNTWMDHEGGSISCDETPGIIGANSRIRLLTFSNDRNNSDTDLQIYKNGTGGGDLFYTWEIRNKRGAYKSNSPLETLTFAAGDTIRVFASSVPGQNPRGVVVKITLINTDNILGEGGSGTDP